MVVISPTSDSVLGQCTAGLGQESAKALLLRIILLFASHQRPAKMDPQRAALLAAGRAQVSQVAAACRSTALPPPTASEMPHAFFSLPLLCPPRVTVS